jgi:hypothetical protein
MILPDGGRLPKEIPSLLRYTGRCLLILFLPRDRTALRRSGFGTGVVCGVAWSCCAKAIGATAAAVTSKTAAAPIPRNLFTLVPTVTSLTNTNPRVCAAIPVPKKYFVSVSKG